MKRLLCSLSLLMAGVVPGYAITVTTPASGAQVTSPFQLTASTSTCSSKPAASMGYSIDSGTTTITTTSFTAAVSAPTGAHVLHVKCWGTKVNQEVSIDITVIPSTVSTPTLSLASGTYKSAQSVALADATPGAIIHYSSNGVAPTTSSAVYEGPITISASTVLEAIAVVSGKTTSGFARGSYVITPPSTPPVIPSNAIVASNLHRLDTWQFNHDAGTPGTAVGETSLVSTPSQNGSARRFASAYTDAGGEIFSVPYANDVVSKNFVYDGWVWI